MRSTCFNYCHSILAVCIKFALEMDRKGSRSKLKDKSPKDGKEKSGRKNKRRVSRLTSSDSLSAAETPPRTAGTESIIEDEEMSFSPSAMPDDRGDGAVTDRRASTKPALSEPVDTEAVS